MTPADIITQVYQDWVNIGSADFSDTVWRRRILRHLRKAARRFWAKHPWPFKQVTFTFSVDTTGVADLSDFDPSFQTFGQQGLVAIPGKNHELRFLPAGRLLRLKELETGQASSLPRYYTLRGSTILVHKPPAVTTDFDFIYDRKFPDILDEDDSGEDVPLDALIPSQYHDTTLIDGVVAYLMEDAGDGRAEEREGKFQRGIAEAWREEKPGRNEPKRQPRYGRGFRRGQWA